jgi:hypothetical protein
MSGVNLVVRSSLVSGVSLVVRSSFVSGVSLVVSSSLVSGVSLVVRSSLVSGVSLLVRSSLVSGVSNQQPTSLLSLDKYYPSQYKLLISLKAFKSYTMVCIYGYEQPIICNLTLPTLVIVHPLVMDKNYNLNKHTNSTVFLLLTSDNVPNTKDSHFSR